MVIITFKLSTGISASLKASSVTSVHKRLWKKTEYDWILLCCSSWPPLKTYRETSTRPMNEYVYADSHNPFNHLTYITFHRDHIPGTCHFTRSTGTKYRDCTLQLRNKLINHREKTMNVFQEKQIYFSLMKQGINTFISPATLTERPEHSTM